MAASAALQLFMNRYLNALLLVGQQSTMICLLGKETVKIICIVRTSTSIKINK